MPITIRERIAAATAHELLTVEELALLSRYHPQTIYRKVERNEIPGVVRYGRGIRFRRVAVLAWSRSAVQNRPTE